MLKGLLQIFLKNLFKKFSYNVISSASLFKILFHVELVRFAILLALLSNSFPCYGSPLEFSCRVDCNLFEVLG